MGDKNIIYNNNLNNHIIPNDTSHKDFAMEALQKRKEKYEQLRQDAIDAVERKHQAHLQMQQDGLDAMERKHQAHLKMQSEDMLKSIPKADIPEGYSINEFGEIIRPGKSR